MIRGCVHHDTTETAHAIGAVLKPPISDQVARGIKPKTKRRPFLRKLKEPLRE
jgi:hypothetical protein